MWRSVSALGMVLATVSPAWAGSLTGTWKGTINGFDSKPNNVQLRIVQSGDSFRGAGTSCPPSAIPGCPVGASDGSISFHGTFLSPGRAGAFSLQFDGPPTTSADVLSPAPTQTCAFFWSAIGSLSADGRAMNFLLRGQDGDCNPILGLINATKQ